MRFDSVEHLEAWRDLGVYPKIHDAVAGAIVTFMQGSRILDLGCSYGLLAQRIMAQLGTQAAVGVDSDAKAIRLAEAAGIGVTLYRMRIAGDTLPQLVRIVKRHDIDVIAARRILPELFGDDLELGRAFAREMAAAGVREMFIEGRVVSESSVNALRSIDEEVALVAGSFREDRRIAAVSYVGVRGALMISPHAHQNPIPMRSPI